MRALDSTPSRGHAPRRRPGRDLREARGASRVSGGRGRSSESDPWLRTGFFVPRANRLNGGSGTTSLLFARTVLLHLRVGSALAGDLDHVCAATFRDVSPRDNVLMGTRDEDAEREVREAYEGLVRPFAKADRTRSSRTSPTTRRWPTAGGGSLFLGRVPIRMGTLVCRAGRFRTARLAAVVIHSIDSRQRTGSGEERELEIETIVCSAASPTDVGSLSISR